MALEAAGHWSADEISAMLGGSQLWSIEEMLMQFHGFYLVLAGLSALLLGCASPPSADPSKVAVDCAQHCSSDLARSSSGFKPFPVIAQQQCNDAYDVCIGGCPARSPGSSSADGEIPARLKQLNELHAAGQITDTEYETKRKEILDSL